MKDHISEVSNLAFYHLRNISHIRKYLTLSAAKTIVHALVCSRIDANNALYYGLHMVQIKKLQRIQNAAARVILRRGKYDHITPTLGKLHWLPVQYRILYKIIIITYKALHAQAPSYLSTLLRNKMCTSYGLRSDDNLLQTQRTHLACRGDRAFSAAAPREWNKLPYSVQSSKDLNIFKTKLKTHLFTICYT